MVKIAVLISGGGTNLQALIDEAGGGNIRGEISLVISNKKKAYGLVRGQKAGIESIHINPINFRDMDHYNSYLLGEFKKRDIGLIVLAGYLKILSQDLVRAYKNRIINIHPSLIPSFSGQGYYGLRVHQAVIDRGCKITGATAHFVDRGTDTGPIILQKALEVREDDSPESLQERLLKLEHEILTEAVKLFCENKIELYGNKTRIGVI